jgi:hypothetical protein
VLLLESDGSVPDETLTAQVRQRVLEATGLLVQDVVVGPRGTVQRTTSGKLRRARTRAKFEAEVARL